jgi:hypothetical protein
LKKFSRRRRNYKAPNFRQREEDLSLKLIGQSRCKSSEKKVSGKIFKDAFHHRITLLEKINYGI